MQQGKVQVETVQFLAEDGYTLTGKLYRSEYAKANIVIACATGVPQAFTGALPIMQHEQVFRY